MNTYMTYSSVVVVPEQNPVRVVTSAGVTEESAIVAKGYAEFASQLGALLPIPVTASEESTWKIEGDKIIIGPVELLLDQERQTDELSTRYGDRLILINVGRSTSRKTAEQSHCCALIEADQYSFWRMGRSEPAAIWGLKATADAIGAEWDDNAVFATEHYARLTHPEYTTLPQLLAAYMIAAYSLGDPSDQN